MGFNSASKGLMHVLQLWKHLRMWVCVCVTLETSYYLREISIFASTFIHMLTASIKLTLLRSVTV